MSLVLTSTKRERWLAHLLSQGIISTPALVIDSSEVKNVLTLFEKFLPEAKIFYAVKANNTPSLIQYLASQNISFDVASAQEILDLRALGIAASRMILSNPIKSPATVNAFFDHGLRLVSIDNDYDLQALAQAKLRTTKKSIDVFVRIKINTTDVQIDLNSKFGCLEHEAVALLKASRDAGFCPRGVQFHVGTQSWNVHNYQNGIETALRIIDAAHKEYGIKCDTINIGGGYPDPVLAKEAGGMEAFFNELSEALAPAIKRGLNIIAEPGRVLVSSASSAVCTVIGKSIRNGTPWLYLDDGAYGLFSGQFFDHKEFHLRVLRQETPPTDTRLIPYVIAGPTCDSIDIVSRRALLPANIEPGDVLCSHNMGAYSIVTASNFNGFGNISTYLDSSERLAEAAQMADLAESEDGAIRKVVNG